MKNKCILLIVIFSFYLGCSWGSNIKIETPSCNEIIYSGVVDISGKAESFSVFLVNGKIISVDDAGDFNCIVKLQNYGLHNISFVGIISSNIVTEDRTVLYLKTFPDIKEHWAKNYIELMATLDLLDGLKGTNLFFPDSYLTREDASVMLLKAARIKPLPICKTSFTDVHPMYWAAPYIEEAVNRNFSSGYQDNKFMPKGMVTRTEGILMAANFAGIKAIEDTRSRSPDLKKNYWANRYLNAAFEKKYFPKTWDLTKDFNPLRSITRAEMAYLLARSQLIRDQIENMIVEDIFSEEEPYIVDQNNEKNSVAENIVKYKEKSPKNICYICPSTLKKNEYFNIKINVDKFIQDVNPNVSVLVDLSLIGRLKNTFLLDDGKWYDEIAGDGIFTIRVKVAPSIDIGKKIMKTVIIDGDDNVVEDEIVLTII